MDTIVHGILGVSMMQAPSGVENKNETSIWTDDVPDSSPAHAATLSKAEETEMKLVSDPVASPSRRDSVTLEVSSLHLSLISSTCMHSDNTSQHPVCCWI